MRNAKGHFLPAGIFIPLFLIMAILSFAMTSSANAVTLTAEVVAGGFTDPIYLESPAGDTSRLFVLEQGGLIKIIKNGVVLGTPFLDITDSVSGGNEQGLLGLTFHPDYSSNGYFYINYTYTNGDTRLVRGKVSGNPDIAEPDSMVTLLSVSQPFANHNAGMLAFSPTDGYLYMGLGDGGSGGDPQNNAQDSTVLLGKMLRIDVDGALPYAIPSDNPFVGNASVPDEICALGLRNPWRYSFDSETGALYIADVGQNEWEEVNYQADGVAGLNYGWRLKEGTHCYNPSTNCDPGGLTDPIYEYPHGPECSITGGYVYRGCAMPDLQGMYFFADFCSGKVWTIEYDGNNVIDTTDRTSELTQDIGAFQFIVSFGQDELGELYILDRGRDEVIKIIPVNNPDCNTNGRNDNCDIALGVSVDANQNGIPDECEASLCGDANADGEINVSDAVWIINYVFAGGDPPDPLQAGEVNCDGDVNVSDAVWIINFVFEGGNEPCDSSGDGQPDC